MAIRSITRLLVSMLASTCAFEATGSELTGTSWQLVRIVSMNDSIDVPNDSAKYTMELLAGGHQACPVAVSAY